MGIEYELKFQASEAVINTILEDFSRFPRQQFQMETTYYDTPSGGLSSRHYTLRRRMENNVSVCTLKTPAKNRGRNELEFSCGSITDALPLFCTGGAPEDFALAVREGLIAVCGAKFHRIAITLEFADCRLELALDSGILTGGGTSIPLSEVEVELKSGTPRQADLFAMELAAKYHLLPETRSKFRRALSLYQGGTL